MYMKNNKGEKVKRPWFTFLIINDEDMEKVILNRVNGEMNSYLIQQEYLKNIDYVGFELNQHVIKEIMNSFHGKIYIAQSLAENYRDEIEELFGTGLVKKEDVIYVNDL